MYQHPDNNPRTVELLWLHVCENYSASLQIFTPRWRLISRLIDQFISANSVLPAASTIGKTLSKRVILACVYLSYRVVKSSLL